MLGRSSRRQSGADRADGGRAQEPHVPATHGHGLQGDRGRLSLRLADRLRLRALDHRERRHSRRRRDPGPDPVPPGTDRAHLRGGQGREEGDRPLLQFDFDPAARGGVPHRSEGRREDRGRRGQAGQGACRRGARGRSFSSNIRRRASPAPSSRSRSRSARRSRTSSGRPPRSGSSSTCRRPSKWRRPTPTPTSSSGSGGASRSGRA